MKKLNAMQTRIRNWEVKRLRGAYALFTKHLGTRAESARLGQAAVDQLLEALGAETETERRNRLFKEDLDNPDTI